MAQTYQQLRAERDELERLWRGARTLNEISAAILATAGDLGRLMDTVRSVAASLRYDHVAVLLRRDDGRFDVRVAYGSFAGTGFSFEHPEVRDRAPRPGEQVVSGAGWEQVVPLGSQDGPIGVLVVASDRPPEHPEEAASLAAILAELVSVGVQTVRAHRQREELAAAAERDRLARDIHDGIAQQLYMLRLNLESCLEANETDALRERLAAALTLSQMALLESRQYVHDLRPLLARDLPLAEALKSLAREFQRVTPLQVDFHASGDEGELSTEARLALYRVAQEALANVFRHAAAHKATLSIELSGGEAILTVSDDGTGLSPQQLSGGRGLQNMHERVEALHGSLEVRSRPGSGTTLRALVPR